MIFTCKIISICLQSRNLTRVCDSGISLHTDNLTNCLLKLIVLFISRPASSGSLYIGTWLTSIKLEEDLGTPLRGPENQRNGDVTGIVEFALSVSMWTELDITLFTEDSFWNFDSYLSDFRNIEYAGMGIPNILSVFDNMAKLGEEVVDFLYYYIHWGKKLKWLGGKKFNYKDWKIYTLKGCKVHQNKIKFL